MGSQRAPNSGSTSASVEQSVPWPQPNGKRRGGMRETAGSPRVPIQLPPHSGTTGRKPLLAGLSGRLFRNAGLKNKAYRPENRSPEPPRGSPWSLHPLGLLFCPAAFRLQGSPGSLLNICHSSDIIQESTRDFLGIKSATINPIKTSWDSKSQRRFGHCIPSL